MDELYPKTTKRTTNIHVRFHLHLFPTFPCMTSESYSTMMMMIMTKILKLTVNRLMLIRHEICRWDLAQSLLTVLKEAKIYIFHGNSKSSQIWYVSKEGKRYKTWSNQLFLHKKCLTQYQLEISQWHRNLFLSIAIFIIDDEILHQGRCGYT